MSDIKKTIEYKMAHAITDEVVLYLSVNEAKKVLQAFREQTTGATPEQVAEWSKANAEERLVILPQPLTTTDIDMIENIGRIVNNLETMENQLKAVKAAKVTPTLDQDSFYFGCNYYDVDNEDGCNPPEPCYFGSLNTTAAESEVAHE